MNKIINKAYGLNKRKKRVSLEHLDIVFNGKSEYDVILILHYIVFNCNVFHCVVFHCIAFHLMEWWEGGKLIFITLQSV